MKQYMVQRFRTQARRLHENTQVVDHLILPAEVLELERTQGILEITFLSGWLIVTYIKLFFHSFLDINSCKIKNIYEEKRRIVVYLFAEAKDN